MKSLKHIENITTLNELSEYYNDIQSYIKLNSYKHFKKYEKINNCTSIYTYQDITNDTIIKLSKSLDKGKTLNGGYIGKTFYSVIIQTLVNESASVPLTYFIEFETPTFDEFDEADESPAEKSINHLKSQLDEDEFDLLVYSTKIPLTDLATLMDIKYTMLYSNIQRIKEKAKKILQQHEQEK